MLRSGVVRVNRTGEIPYTLRGACRVVVFVRQENHFIIQVMIERVITFVFLRQFQVNVVNVLVIIVVVMN